MILLADDLGYGDLGSFGHPTIATPNLDRMAAEGLKLTSFYVAGPACSPSRAALLTGRYPMRSGVYRVLRLEDTGGLPPSEVTMAEALGAAGYRTLALGKWHVGHRSPFLPTENGFASFHGLLYSNNMDEPDQPLRLYRDAEPAARRRRSVIADQDLHRRSDARSSATPAIGHSCSTWRTRCRTCRSMLPSGSPATSRRGSYGDAVQEHRLERRRDPARSARRPDSTTVPSWSSPATTGRGSPRRLDGGSAGLLRDGKNTTYEGGMRVPCIARWPGRIPPVRSAPSSPARSI